VCGGGNSGAVASGGGPSSARPPRARCAPPGTTLPRLLRCSRAPGAAPDPEPPVDCSARRGHGASPARQTRYLGAHGLTARSAGSDMAARTGERVSGAGGGLSRPAWVCGAPGPLSCGRRALPAVWRMLRLRRGRSAPQARTASPGHGQERGAPGRRGRSSARTAVPQPLQPAWQLRGGRGLPASRVAGLGFFHAALCSTLSPRL
jgi:hypothetical protein